MPDLSSFAEKYWSADALVQGGVLLTVKSAQLEEIGDDKEVKPVVYFEEDRRGYVLNQKNYAVLTDITGAADTDEWPGRQVRLERATFTKRGEEIAYVKAVNPLRKGA